MVTIKKYLAELFGTFVLVLFGCGAASISGGIDGVLGVLGIAMAFGLSIVAMAYVIGNISGCHINPAVSFGMLLSGKMKVKDFFGYIIAQFIGGIAAIALLKAIVDNSALGVSAGLGANGFDSLSHVTLSMLGAVIVEVVLTCIFVLVILGVTSDAKYASVAGIVIGLTLAFVHILGIPLTGTSVNPARSLAPALFTGGLALQQVWIFIVAPFFGSVVAALIWKYLKPADVK